MDKLLFKRILVAALTLLALVYVAYLLISANFNMYPTENAVQATVTDRILTNAYIIRDEHIIENNSEGVLSYSVANGEAVNAGGEIAKIYSNEEDAVANTRAESLVKKKEALESIQKTVVSGTMSIDIINNAIKSKLITMIDDTNNRSLTNAKSDADVLLNSINLRQLYTGKVTDFSSEIASAILPSSATAMKIFMTTIKLSGSRLTSCIISARRPFPKTQRERSSVMSNGMLPVRCLPTMPAHSISGTAR